MHLFWYSNLIFTFSLFYSNNTRSASLFSSLSVPTTSALKMRHIISTGIIALVLYPTKSGVSPISDPSQVLIVHNSPHSFSIYFPLAPSKKFCRILTIILFQRLCMFSFLGSIRGGLPQFDAKFLIEDLSLSITSSQVRP